jgi:TetR/AcrR family transcriptional regulator, mexCD-oprJ operon repressor
MAEPATDHRRATAERNVAAILDAVEALLQRGARLSVTAVAAEAGLSRVTVYAHFASIEDLFEAVMERAVTRARAVLDEAEPASGDAAEALERVIAAAWRELDRNSAVAQATSDHLVAAAVTRTHDRVLSPIRELVQRGREEGAFRTDVPADWLVTSFFTLLHACGDEVRAGRLRAQDAPRVLTVTIGDMFAAEPREPSVTK